MSTQALVSAVDTQALGTKIERFDPITRAIAAWVHEKFQHSRSERTKRAYEKTLRSFRAHLQAKGLDLDSPRPLIKPYLQGWAAAGAGESGATQNQRLAIVSSFYKHAHKNDAFFAWVEDLEEREGQSVTIRRRIPLDNPADYCERANVKPYAKAVALKPSEVEEKLQTIDQTTPLGLRDYALLAVAFTTGRRLAELAGLQRQDIHLRRERPKGQKAREVVTLTWRRAKGNKKLADDLEPAVGEALVRYLRAVYGPDWQAIPAEAPLWLAFDFARSASSGRKRTPRRTDAPLGVRAISYLCKRHLDTGKVHVTRHSFALGMMKAGAPVDVIQERLAHESLETTAEYLPKLERAENPYAPGVAALFGLGKKQEAGHGKAKRDHRAGLATHRRRGA
jgi:site-specific recombinase XerD